MDIQIQNLSNVLFSNALNDKQNINIKLMILDPLTTIIKLAILGKKAQGTKIIIQSNVIYLQEPGFFQPVCRLSTNKAELHYLYNPIKLACKLYLTKEIINVHPNIVELFKLAQHGIKMLMETYKACSMVCIGLHMFHSIIALNIDNNAISILHNYTDAMSVMYTETNVNNMHKYWDSTQIKIVLDVTMYIKNTNSTDVKPLADLMLAADEHTVNVLANM